MRLQKRKKLAICWKTVSEIKSELGVPTDDYIDELGNETLVFKTKNMEYLVKESLQLAQWNNGGFPQVDVFNTCKELQASLILILSQ